jgi:hypothetical protein
LLVKCRCAVSFKATVRDGRASGGLARALSAPSGPAHAGTATAVGPSTSNVATPSRRLSALPRNIGRFNTFPVACSQPTLVAANALQFHQRERSSYGCTVRGQPSTRVSDCLTAGLPGSIATYRLLTICALRFRGALGTWPTTGTLETPVFLVVCIQLANYRLSISQLNSQDHDGLLQTRQGPGANAQN